MRSAILTIVVLGLLVGAFAIFMVLQPSTVPQERAGVGRPDDPSTRPATRSACACNEPGP